MDITPDSFSLRGRTAVVTGGAGVLGSKIAEGLGLAGAKILVLDLARYDEAAAELRKKGLDAKGMAADIVAFDPRRARDIATFEDPHRYPEGIEYVLVNGSVTVERGEHTREKAGQIIRHKVSVA